MTKVPVYDIKNCGPRHRFVANGKLVHNSDRMNVQNLPSRGANAKQIKKCIVAPKGHVLIDADSSQIEARVLAWWAGQDDLVQAFRDKEDAYVKLASRIYGKDVSEITKDERFVGKTALLGCGYGMGAVRFREQLRTFGYDLTINECTPIINVYRESNPQIVALWREAGNVLAYLARGQALDTLGLRNIVQPVGDVPGLRLPSGLLIRYAGLSASQGEKGIEYSYKTRRGPVRIYGGKVVENCTQGIARCIVAWQMLNVARKYKVAMTVHDSIVACVRESEAEEAQAYIEMCMRQVPSWAEGLPVDCESGVARAYGDCEA